MTKMKDFYGMAEAMPFQNKSTIDFSRSLWSRALSKLSGDRFFVQPLHPTWLWRTRNRTVRGY
jgi:hypothetical protein